MTRPGRKRTALLIVGALVALELVSRSTASQAPSSGGLNANQLGGFGSTPDVAPPDLTGATHASGSLGGVFGTALGFLGL